MLKSVLYIILLLLCLGSLSSFLDMWPHIWLQRKGGIHDRLKDYTVSEPGLQNKLKSSPLTTIFAYMLCLIFSKHGTVCMHNSQTSPLWSVFPKKTAQEVLWFVHIQCCNPKVCCCVLFREYRLFLTVLSFNMLRPVEPFFVTLLYMQVNSTICSPNRTNTSV